MLGLLLLTSGCLDLNFDPISILKGPRMLAISANPPESLPGEDIHFETLIVDENGDDLSTQPGIEVRFEVCLSIAQVFNAAGLGSSTTAEDNCGVGGDDLLVLAQDGAPNRAILPGEVLVGLLSMIPMPDPDMPPPDPMIPGIDPALFSILAEVIAEVGVPLLVRVEVDRDGERILDGHKRFAITTRSGATLNPPPPRLMIDELEVTARGGADPHVCVAADGSTATATVGAEVTLAPDPLEEPWLETYPVFDLQNGLIENSESAYYSWFSNAGSFSRELSQSPLRDSVWTAPEEPGTYPFFVVVRDGHLGHSWCRFEIEVR